MCKGHIVTKGKGARWLSTILLCVKVGRLDPRCFDIFLSCASCQTWDAMIVSRIVHQTFYVLDFQTFD